jgi:hypothetical protein
VAVALRDWLPNVFQDADPFASGKDIQGGARWEAEIAERRERTAYGSICVTRENQNAPWINFEAGALAKSLNCSFVTPLAVDLKPSVIKYPLAQFQAVAMASVGIFALVESINAVTDGVKLLPDRLRRISTSSGQT